MRKGARGPHDFPVGRQEGELGSCDRRSPGRSSPPPPARTVALHPQEGGELQGGVPWMGCQGVMSAGSFPIFGNKGDKLRSKKRSFLVCTLVGKGKGRSQLVVKEEVEKSKGGASGGISLWTRGDLLPQQQGCGESTASMWANLGHQGQALARVTRTGKGVFWKSPPLLGILFPVPSSPPSGWLPIAPGTLSPLSGLQVWQGPMQVTCGHLPLPATECEPDMTGLAPLLPHSTGPGPTLP